MKRNMIELQVILATVIFLRYNTALDIMYDKLDDTEVQPGECGAMDMVMVRWSIISCAYSCHLNGGRGFLYEPSTTTCRCYIYCTLDDSILNMVPGQHIYRVVPREGAVRLIGTPMGSGRVEIYHNSQWGTVCKDKWSGSSCENAHVVCTQLGYAGGEAERDNDVFGPGTGMIWLDDLECDGIEESILDCPANDWGDHNCHDDHTEDVAVICTVV